MHLYFNENEKLQRIAVVRRGHDLNLVSVLVVGQGFRGTEKSIL